MAYIGQNPIDAFRGLASYDTFTGDGSTTTFDLTKVAPDGGQNDILVVVNNVIQEPGVSKSYTLGVDGNGDYKRVTFNTAPEAADEIYIINPGRTTSLNTVSDNAITAAKLNITSITGQTALTTGVQGDDTLLIYDDSATSLKKITLDNLIIGQTALSTGVQGADTLLIYDDSATEIKKINLDDLITGQTALSTGVQGADTLLIYDDSATEIKKINLDDLITGQTELAATPADDDVLLVYDTSATEIKKVQKSYLNPTLTYSSGTATGDGSTTAFVISSGRTVEDVLVFVNGFQLTPTTDYTISGTTLTFTTAPANNAEITYRYLPLSGAYTSANFTGNGASTTITIDAGRAVNDVLVVVNGLTLVPTDDYTIAGTTLTFSTAPANLAEITVRYLRLS
jgi:hypothetical protein